MNLTWHGPSEEYDVWLAALPSHKGQNPPHESFFNAIPTASESDSSQVVLLRNSCKGPKLRELRRLACEKHIAINSNMGHQLWRKLPRMIASIDCPSLCWLGKPLNVQPYFAQLVLLFLLAWSRKERKAHEWPIPGGTLWFCFCLVVLGIENKVSLLTMWIFVSPRKSHALR